MVLPAGGCPELRRPGPPGHRCLSSFERRWYAMGRMARLHKTHGNSCRGCVTAYGSVFEWTPRKVLPLFAAV